MLHLLLVAVLGLAGCVHTEYGNADIKNKNVIDQVQMGKSTKDDVRKLLGSPSSTSKGKLPEARPGDASYDLVMDEWWVYFHGNINHDARMFIPYAGFFFGNTNHDADHFVVGFDGKGIVQHISSGEQHVKTRGIVE